MGVPINGMENGRVYWSNWAGLSDVTRLMQVQRGLGASRVAVPSVGGTINILTKTTDAEEGGNVFMSAGMTVIRNMVSPFQQVQWIMDGLQQLPYLKQPEMGT